MLRGIERRVLDDVWIDRRLRLFTVVVTACLATAAALGWADVHDRAAAGTPGVAGCAVALTLFTSTAVMSSIALLRSCFRWCTLAAYGGGIGTVVGVGVVWWHQTTPIAQSPGPSPWMAAGALCSAALTVLWLRAVLTPLERSQPDLRLSPKSRAAVRPTPRHGPA